MTLPNKSKSEVHTLESGCHPDCPDYQGREVFPQSEKVDEDLEAAAETYSNELFELMGDGAVSIMKGVCNDEYFEGAFKAGAEWQKAKDKDRIEELTAIAKSNSDPTALVELLQNNRELESKLAKVREQTVRDLAKYLKEDLCHSDLAEMLVGNFSNETR